MCACCSQKTVERFMAVLVFADVFDIYANLMEYHFWELIFRIFRKILGEMRLFRFFTGYMHTH